MTDAHNDHSVSTGYIFSTCTSFFPYLASQSSKSHRSNTSSTPSAQHTRSNTPSTQQIGTHPCAGFDGYFPSWSSSGRATRCPRPSRRYQPRPRQSLPREEVRRPRRFALQHRHNRKFPATNLDTPPLLLHSKRRDIASSSSSASTTSSSPPTDSGYSTPHEPTTSPSSPRRRSRQSSTHPSN
jgi:hypothetical protein